MESSVVLSFLVAIFVCAHRASPTVQDGNPLQFADIKFTCDLYALLVRKQPGEDIFFSPFSITSALGMLKVGAGGSSAEQIQTALGLTGDPNQAHKQYSSLKSLLEEEMQGNVTIKMANKLFAAQSNMFGIPEDFTKTLATYYGTSLERLNFGESEVARNTINQWVEQVTRNKIKDLIPSGSLDGNTRLVIANAIYFQGDWAERFEKRSTRPEDFYVSESHTVKVDMMRNTAEFDVAETDDAHIVDLPYKGHEIIMTLVVPKEKTGLTGIEKSLQGPMLRNFIFDASRTRMRVQLSMPKFRIESSFGLKDLLVQIGIKDVFTPGLANLTGMTTDKKEPLYVSEGFHKAFVEVDEKGTEAAAATGIVVTLRSGRVDPPPRLLITVDHPSLVIIRHNKIVEPLFFGRLMSPPVAGSKRTDSKPDTAASGARKTNPQEKLATMNSSAPPNSFLSLFKMVMVFSMAMMTFSYSWHL